MVTTESKMTSLVTSISDSSYIEAETSSIGDLSSSDPTTIDYTFETKPVATTTIDSDNFLSG